MLCPKQKKTILKPILNFFTMKNHEKTASDNSTLAKFKSAAISKAQTKKIKGGGIGTTDILDI